MQHYPSDTQGPFAFSDEVHMHLDGLSEEEIDLYLDRNAIEREREENVRAWAFILVLFVVLGGCAFFYIASRVR